MLEVTGGDGVEVVAVDVEHPADLVRGLDLGAVQQHAVVHGFLRGRLATQHRDNGLESGFLDGLQEGLGEHLLDRGHPGLARAHDIPGGWRAPGDRLLDHLV